MHKQSATRDSPRITRTHIPWYLQWPPVRHDVYIRMAKCHQSDAARAQFLPWRVPVRAGTDTSHSAPGRVGLCIGALSRHLLVGFSAGH
eukprot:2464941-Prymnesium_polylepis.1